MLEVRAELLHGAGYLLTICRRRVEGWVRKRVVFDPIADAQGDLRDLNPLTAAILDELRNAGKLTARNGGYFLPFSAAAQLGNADALSLNLLPPFPHQLDLQSRGTLGTRTFTIEY